MKAKPPVLLLIVATSFGEVDWILPVLIAFKRKYPEWRIITLFGHQLVFQKLAQNPELFAEFSNISSLNIVPEELDALFSRDISPADVRIILKDFNQDEFSPYKTEIENRCPNALVVSYPHSNFIYANRTSEPMRRPADPDAYSRHDLFLLSSAHDIPYWSGYVDPDKIRTFGYPALDAGWTRQLVASDILKGSEEYARARAAGKVFFHVSRHPHPVYLSDADYRYLNRSLVEEVFAHDDAFLLIKPHPRQDLTEFAALLKGYDPSRWMFSGLHLTQLSAIADVVVAYYSSGILNALSVDKPVIEFYRFGPHNPDWRRLPDGSPTSIYRELGLAVPADSAADLRRQIRSALEGEDPVWQFQRQAFGLHCRIHPDASAAIAECLMQALERKEKGAAPAPPAEPETGVDAHIRQRLHLVEQLVAKGEPQAAGHFLERLMADYPDHPEVLNNYGVFLFNEGKFVEAIETLIQGLSRAPDCQETAVNLIQMLMAVERHADAVDIAVQFYRRNPGGALQESFLYLLVERLPAGEVAMLQEGIRERLAAIEAETGPA